MKPQNEVFDKNISRLVKLTRDSQRPSDTFNETLMNNALQELQGQAGQTRKEGLITMKKKTLITTTAASVLVLIGLTVYTQHLSNQGHRTGQDASASLPGLVPLPISLPRAQFTGTPTNLRGIPNLEPPVLKTPPVFLVPADVKNVAVGRPVTASMDPPIMGDLSQVVDGDKEATEDGLVDLGPMKEWVQIDLESPQELYAVQFWHFHKQARVYYDVVVQVADDPDFITNVRILFNNDIDNSSGLGVGTDKNYIDTFQGKLVDAKKEVAQYIRLYCNENNANDRTHYLEVEVYGRPISE